MKTRESRIQTVALFLITCLGAGFRFYELDAHSLWNDELSSWARSNYHSLRQVLDEGVRYDVHPPAFHVLLYLLERYVGDTETILRLPSAIAGTLVIPVVFLIGRRLFSAKEGLVASLLMAIMWCPIYYSQEARSYSLLLLLTSLATCLWLDIMASLRNESSPAETSTVHFGVAVAYIIVSVTASYLHYYGLYFVALQGLGTLLLAPLKVRTFRYAITVYGLIVLAYVPWLPSMIIQATHGASGHLGRPTILDVYYYLRFLFNFSKYATALSLLVIGVYLVYYLILAKKECSELFATLLLIAWFSVPFAGSYLISTFVRPVHTTHSMIISLPAAILLLARALTDLPIGRAGRPIATGGMVGLFLWHLIFRLGYYSEPQKEQFREAVVYVIEQSKAQETPLVIGCCWNTLYFDYYFEKNRSPLRVAMEACLQQDIGAVAELIEARDPDHFWFLVGHRKPDPQLVDYLRQGFDVATHQDYRGASATLYERR